MWREYGSLLIPPIVSGLRRKIRRRARLGRITHRLENVRLKDLFPGIETVVFTLPCSEILGERGQLPVAESAVLASMCKHLRPRRIFEIGTYRGASALIMAMNTPPESEILTLDLDPARRADTKYRLEMGDIGGVPFVVGGTYRGTDFEPKIHQLYGDSALFDFQPFYGSGDLVFVDGNHGYENVKSDSENAFRVVRGGGIVLWDDYHPEWGPGVMGYLNEIEGSKRVVQIDGTRLAVYRQDRGFMCGE